MIDALKLSELLAVKLCHDLAGPVGAVNNGADLLKDGGDNIFEQALDLVEASAKEAVARILYYRQAYGTSSTQGETSIASLKTLADNLFTSKNITINWLDSKEQTVNGMDAKIILNLITIISNSLVYGGTLTIKTANKIISIRGEGKAVKADEEIFGLLSTNPDNKITVKNVHAYLVSQILKEIKAKAVLNSANDYIEVVVS